MSSRRSQLFFAVFMLSLILCNPSSYSWPFGDKKEKKSSAPTPVPSVSAAPNVATPQAAPAIPDLPTIPKIPTTEELQSVKPPVKTVPVTREVEIARIKSQIQEIIKINENLKASYADQAAEIQKISEQAKIHQRILKDLETAKEQQKIAQASSQSFLDNEKIKLIQKETEKSQKFLTALQGEEITKNVKPIPMQEQDARKS